MPALRKPCPVIFPSTGKHIKGSQSGFPASRAILPEPLWNRQDLLCSIPSHRSIICPAKASSLPVHP